jgi:hypothetical protein
MPAGDFDPLSQTTVRMRSNAQNKFTAVGRLYGENGERLVHARRKIGRRQMFEALGL